MAHRIAVIAGDGIGPEVVAQGLRVLHAAADRFGFELEITEYPYGTEHWLATEEILPDAPFAEIQQADAILLGADLCHQRAVRFSCLFASAAHPTKEPPRV